MENNPAQLEQMYLKAIDEVKAICKKSGMEKNYIFSSTKTLSATQDDASLSASYSFEINSKDLPYKTMKPIDEFEKLNVNLRKRFDFVIEPGHICNIGDPFPIFEAKKMNIGIDTEIVKRKSSI